MVSTHSRLKAAGAGHEFERVRRGMVSTHSRLKAADGVKFLPTQ